jgi:fructose-1,6-bisphosphatase II / sedoheptulose-1,7-bisphosphatase
MKHLILDITTSTEKAAIAAHALIGMGNEHAADLAAVEAMRHVLNELSIDGHIVIGEGERDEAPMLYIGEKLGIGGIKLDIAVDPLEGTTILANAASGALSVLACSHSGSLLNAPDVYMDKIAIGFDFPEQIINLENTTKENLDNIAAAKKCKIDDLLVIILDRPRHQELISKVRLAGSRVKLIQDGDVAAVIATTMPSTGAHVYMGIGGAPEGVLAASALKTTGGQICGRLIFRNNDEQSRATKLGIMDLNKQYFLHDMVKSDVIFIATGVTDGWLLRGVKYIDAKVSTETLAMYSGDKSIRTIRSTERSNV